MGFLQKSKINATEIFQQSYQYLVEKYEVSRNLLTAASPFTQLLLVSAEIGELIFFYIENALSELNFLKARNQENIAAKARLVGHNSTRGISATGKISLMIKPGAMDEFKGDYFSIPKYAKLNCLTNGLTYLLLTETDTLKVRRHSNELQNVKIIQGELVSQTFVSNGQARQSYSVVSKEMVDHFFVECYVNDKRWTVFDSIYDMNRDDEGVLIKTGLNGGIDAYFGTGNFGKIPDNGALIEFKYLKTKGSSGNIGSTVDTFLKFEDFGIDVFGEDVDLNKTLLINVVAPPSLGSDSENVEFTRIIAPKASKSFVLAHPDNYVYFLRRYNYFSFIDAYNTVNDKYPDDDNIIYLFLLPDIRKKLTSDTNYFTIDTKEFVLTKQEVANIKATLNESGQQLTGSEVKFVEPIIKKYAINIVLRYFDHIEKSIIDTNIKTKLNEYFLSIRRRDKIPRSDLVSLIENIDGVDSVNVFFISEENEKAVANGFYTKQVYGFDSVKKRRELIKSKKITIPAGSDPNLGLDEFGDIKIGENELCIIRGGWKDRNKKLYEVYPNSNKLSSVNIFFKEKIKFDLVNKINQQNIKKLKS